MTLRATRLRIAAVSAVMVLSALALAGIEAAPAAAAWYDCAFSAKGAWTGGGVQLNGPASCSRDGAAPESGTFSYAGDYKWDVNSFLYLDQCVQPTTTGTATLSLPGRSIAIYPLQIEFAGAVAYLHSSFGTGRGAALPEPCINGPITLTAQFSFDGQLA
jgi:hypothetical protein